MMCKKCHTEHRRRKRLNIGGGGGFRHHCVRKYLATPTFRSNHAHMAINETIETRMMQEFLGCSNEGTNSKSSKS